MKAFSSILVLAGMLLAFGAGLAFPEAEAECAYCPGRVWAIFSPGAESAITGLIDSANETIEVEMYQFSNMALADALVSAGERGVRVRVILEPRLDGDDNLDMMGYLRKRGVDARWATLSFSRTHTKVMIIDGKIVLSGSQNWSYSAMSRNREAAIVVEGEEMAQEFGSVFEEDWARAG